MILAHRAFLGDEEARVTLEEFKRLEIFIYETNLEADLYMFSHNEGNGWDISKTFSAANHIADHEFATKDRHLAWQSQIENESTAAHNLAMHIGVLWEAVRKGDVSVASSALGQLSSYPFYADLVIQQLQAMANDNSAQASQILKMWSPSQRPIHRYREGKLLLFKRADSLIVAQAVTEQAREAGMHYMQEMTRKQADAEIQMALLRKAHEMGNGKADPRIAPEGYRQGISLDEARHKHSGNRNRRAVRHTF